MLVLIKQTWFGVWSGRGGLKGNICFDNKKAGLCLKGWWSEGNI